MIVVAVTGCIGSGKSTVAALLAERGAIVIDADHIARQVVAPDGPSYQAVVDHFGLAVVTADGTLDRAAIAARVFSDPAELAVLNAITHPAIAAVTLSRLAEVANAERALGERALGERAVGELAVDDGREVGGGPLVVLDLPLLAEGAKQRYGLAGVVVVDVPVETAIRRLVERRGLAEADAEARVRAQVGREERGRLADVVVDNSGSRQELEANVEAVWAWLRRISDCGKTDIRD